MKTYEHIALILAITATVAIYRVAVIACYKLWPWKVPNKYIPNEPPAYIKNDYGVMEYVGNRERKPFTGPVSQALIAGNH